MLRPSRRRKYPHPHSLASKQKIFQVEGLVLSKFERSERDMVFSLLTRERGRILVLAKYAKKVPSRHNAGLELFNVVRCQLYEGRYLPVVTQVQQVESFDGILSSVERIEYAYKLCLLVDTLLQREQGGEESYALSTESLRSIACSDGNQARSIVVGTGIRLLSLIGNLHWSEECQQCDIALTEKIYCLEGKLLCAPCGTRNRADGLGQDVYAIIRSVLIGRGWKEWETMEPEPTMDALGFIQRQVTSLSYPSYLEKASFNLSVSPM